AHTIGKARCTTFRSRIYNETNIDPSFAKSLQKNCPISGGDNNLASLDTNTPIIDLFDNGYFRDLVNKKGLLHSDQVLFDGGSTDSQVQSYVKNPNLFQIDFAKAMVKMGKLSPLISANALATTSFSSPSSLLSPNYYGHSCPQALNTIRRVVENAVQTEPRMGASLLRLHFHDCFVNGCDGSILLDPTSTIDSEKNAFSNKNSVRGFEVVDEIKKAVDKAYRKPIVSCADILAVAARDSVVALGGPTWKVRLGRRDSTTASRNDANKNLPIPSSSLSQLISIFNNHGLNEKDLVVLSGAHTIGFARCVSFKDHIYNDTNINPYFVKRLKFICPKNGGGNPNIIAPLDAATAVKFDASYYGDLVHKQGLLHSDQELFNGGSTDGLVKKYWYDHEGFYKDFAESMIKMGNIKPLTGKHGEIRLNCRKVNKYY
ncbi:hypothetical protein PIB30_074280, partial [Stylosanthes scabra]|nr:hypothetical protein [Stylosanthes scabra]